MKNVRFVNEEPRNACVVRVFQSVSRQQRSMAAAGLDASNVGSRIVSAKQRAVYHTLDDTAISLAALGSIASGLPDKNICVDLTEVSADRHAAVVVTLTKAMYEFGVYTSKVRHVVSFKGTRDMSAIIDAITLAADLENEPANMMAPETFAARVSAWFSGDARVRVRTLHAKELRAEGFGLIDAVGKGAAAPPCLLLLEHMPVADGPTIVLVGKGVVFDSGGLSLKPPSGMAGMHADKSGAAVTAAIFRHFTKTRTNIVAIMPLVENAVSGASTRPGDIVRCHNGTTVEVVDPDAEGRLIIADAIAYAERYKPTYLLDFATMTGYGESIHHDLSAAIYAQNDRLARLVAEAGEHVGERCWRMPPWPEYVGVTASSVADYRNAGWTTYDEGFMGAMFILNFVPPLRRDGWVHFDISKNTSGRPGVFTATGVAVGIEFIERLGGLRPPTPRKPPARPVKPRGVRPPTPRKASGIR